MRRLLLPVTVSALLAASLVAVPAAQAAPASDLLTPVGGVPTATITRTAYGIPHIVAKDYVSLGFGHGYAVAEQTICTLADTLVTGRGERSRFFGPDERYDDQVTLKATNLQVDTLFGNLRDRKVVEGLLADPVRGPGKEIRALVDGYVQGLNHYLDVVGGPDGIKDPACKGGAWVRKAEPLDLYYGIYAANLLASAGVFVPQIADASPPTIDDPGLPVSAPAAFAPVPAQLPSQDALLAGLGKDPAATFGSNGTALGGDFTDTGRGMVLGNPHFPWRGRYRFTQAQLTIPGVYDIAGASLNGSPVVNIGWNNDVAWTHTVSTGYRFTPYEYRTVPGQPTTYVTESGPKQLMHDDVKVAVLKDDGSVGEVTRGIYRTDEGYVLDAPSVLLGWTPASFFALRDANAEHLRTLDAFHEMGKAHSVAQLADAENRTGGIPWVNTLSADREGNASYSDHAVVPNVPDDLVQQCATPIGQVLVQLAGLPVLDGSRAQGDCAWRDDPDAARPGIFGPGNQPTETRRDFVMNSNDSYWLPNPAQPLEGFDRIIGCEQCERSLRTRMVYRYNLDRMAGSDDLGGGRKISLEQLKAIEHTNRVYAAELSRENDDLQTVCAAADGGKACDVLAAWSGRDDVDARGAILFREFWNRVPADSFQVPFDASDPVNTPRDLDETSDAVVQAMRDAIAFLAEKGIAVDAPLGSQQVAGDEGAPRISVDGGPGSTGNANVVSTGAGVANTDALYPVAYGSSHIQAVSFTDSGVKASTILTYGLATDVTLPTSSDQTRLFGKKQWVDFPFAAADVRAQAVSTQIVSGSASPAVAASAAPSSAPSTDVRAAPAGRLPATGSSAGLAGLAGLALLSAVLLRRRRRIG